MADEQQEQPEEPVEDERDQTIRVWHNVVVNSLNTGMVYVESFDCPHCKSRKFVCHLGAEILVCPACGSRVPSIVIRPPAPGEQNIGHYELALNTLYTMSLQTQANLPPLTDDDFAKMTPDMKLLLARGVEQSRVKLLKTVRAVAAQLADIGNE